MKKIILIAGVLLLATMAVYSVYSYGEEIPEAEGCTIDICIIYPQGTGAARAGTIHKTCDSSRYGCEYCCEQCYGYKIVGNPNCWCTVAGQHNPHCPL